MPLTEKGQKLKDKFRGQYGKKKGDSIFYAMENSGKLKKVMKAQAGGGADALVEKNLQEEELLNLRLQIHLKQKIDHLLLVEEIKIY